MQLIVLGMHRSGTSVLARLLNMMGTYFAAEGGGTRANPENPKGFWERRDVRDLNDLLLYSVRCDWNRIAGFDRARIPESVLRGYRDRAARIVLDMDAHRPWFLKEPRLCLLFPLWRDLLEVPYCIHICRNPLEVANSLERRNDVPMEAGLALWEKYNIEAFNASTGLPRTLVSHHRLMADPVAVVAELYDQLSGFGIQGLRKPARAEIAAFVRDDLYRARSDEAGLASCLNPEQMALFQGIKCGSILRDERKIACSEKGRLALLAYESGLKPLMKPRKIGTDVATEDEAGAWCRKLGYLPASLKFLRLAPLYHRVKEKYEAWQRSRAERGN